MTTDEANQTMQLALGRLFRLLSRPEQDGDIEQFYRCRGAIMEAAAVIGISGTTYQPSVVRDRGTGAQGQW